MNRFEQISAAVRSRGFALPSEVAEIVEFANRKESAVAHAMVGDLIQLLDDTSEYTLDDAEAAYLRAVATDPGYAEAYTSLGHFYDAVKQDTERARAAFEKAAALGDDEAADAMKNLA